MSEALHELEQQPVVAPRRYRDLMGSFATGVTVLTLAGVDGEPTGVTVNSMTSVSLDPPVLLICLHRDSRTRVELEASRKFVLNVLASHQERLSRRFASSEVDDRFDGVPIGRDGRGVPVLRRCAARIECRLMDTSEVGDHTVFYALVTGGQVTDRPALVFHRGRYASLDEA